MSSRAILLPKYLWKPTPWCFSSLSPFLLVAPFSARVIVQRQNVIDALLTITLVTLPFSLMIVIGLYAWSLLLEIIGIEEGKSFCRAIDGRDQRNIFG